MSRVTVGGAAIHYTAHGEGEPRLVLLHGGGANESWWDPVLDRLAPGRCVVTLDLSGHGESDRREAYPMATWAEEVNAVIEVALDGPAVLVAHSMGGRVAPLAALARPDLVEALVIVDSAMPLPPSFRAPTAKPARIYASEEEALARFRLMPEQPVADPELVAHVGRRSVTAVEGGWTWKFDPRIYAKLSEAAPEDALPDLRCPVVLVQGELSEVVDPSLAADFARRLGRPAPLVTIPGAHHHVMLDDPGALATVLDWLPETRVRTNGAGPGSRR